MNTSNINSKQEGLLIPDHYLTIEEMEQIEAKLLDEQKTIQKERMQLMKTIEQDHSDKGDLIDRANKECELEIESKILERDNRSLNQIGLALSRIKNDEDFGYCNCCGEPIGFNRLMVRPFTKECIDCKSLKELDQMHERIRTGK